MIMVTALYATIIVKATNFNISFKKLPDQRYFPEFNGCQKVPNVQEPYGVTDINSKKTDMMH